MANLKEEEKKSPIIPILEQTTVNLLRTSPSLFVLHTLDIKVNANPK